ncbi:hypothetical protein RJT34_22021 [Clitoria ternatea]|uniref:ADP-ribosyl cyclase/cyclic ADP-ribose hydrolase n=1 Tax=Clitoria ternatea TaxID=43366 RepID=A0AAN9P631_CLITE
MRMKLVELGLGSLLFGCTYHTQRNGVGLGERHLFKQHDSTVADLYVSPRFLFQQIDFICLNGTYITLFIGHLLYLLSVDFNFSHFMGSIPSFSSESNSERIYDVFINFRGKDTRKNFVSHLHSALANAGVNTFLDDAMFPTEIELKEELFRAIEGSRICIVVFSKSYTESSWCLNELEKIMECHRTFGQVVLPVFYDVDPTDVRHQKGDFGKALEALARKKFSREGEKYALSNWGSVLTAATNLCGWDVRTSRNEAELVKKIVEEVLRKLDDTLLPITEFPVGLESRVQEVVRFIQYQPNKFCIIGIWGMGGSGKTTTAKAIYNKIHRDFVARSFIESVREVCERDNKGHIDLQKQLLSDVLNTKAEVQSIAKGTSMIEKRLRGRKVFIVLDDVSKFDQVKALCGNRKWIGDGSVLIITTRDVRVLNLLKVDAICKMKEMDKNESLELFSWHAFREASPTKDFSELSSNVVAYCGGLPLALEVLGSHLYERTKEEWKSVLSKLKRIPNEQVQEKLRISYDGLDKEEKDIFLDLCCFFIGKDRAYVTDIINGCGLHAEIGITILIERSLIKVEKSNKVAMHDLLRDMGQEIVRQSAPRKPENNSRLFVRDEVLHVLKQHNGTVAIEGLALKLERTSKVCFNTKAFEKMKRLRLLKLNHVQLVGDYEYLPKHLTWVYWQGFPLKHIPDNFYHGNVVAIDMKYSNIKSVWREPQLLERLKILNLSHSSYLTQTPDFSKLPNLEKLLLKDCPRLSEVHQSIGDLNNLLVINLKDCTSLNCLPTRIYQLKSLKTLILSGCSKIETLEEDIVQMESLTTLIAKDTAIKEVPRSIVRSKSIGYISLCGYEGLSHDVFPSIIWSWMSPTMNPLSHIHPLQGLSLSQISISVQNNNLGDLAPIFSCLLKLHGVQVQFSSKDDQIQEIRNILTDLYNVNFIELDKTSCTSQVSNMSLRSLLIGMGSYHQIIDMLSKSTTEALTTNSANEFFLPDDNYPHWLTFTNEGHSIPFQVPADSDCHIKGMILCVLYSSTTENKACEHLNGVLIFNYTKCTLQIYRQDTIMLFNDGDWQGLISNLGPGDNVEIFVAFGPRITVKKTALYLLYGQSTATKMEPSVNVKMESSLKVMNMQPSPSVTMKPSLKVTTKPSSSVTMEPSSSVTMEPSSKGKTDPLLNVEMQPSPEVELERYLKSRKNIYTRLTKRIGECLCLNGK